MNLTHFYHGSIAHPTEVLFNGGLKPRGELDGNWKHSVPSRKDAVYLTDVYAGYFAIAAASKKETPTKAYVYEIVVDRLDSSKMIPDEDFIEQATRGQIGNHLASPKAPMIERTKFYRDRSHNASRLWKDSMQHLGTAAHLGPISGVAISRYVELDLEHLGWLTFTLGDPMISLTNHKYCSAKYRAVTEWLFGDRSIKAHEWMGLTEETAKVMGLEGQHVKLQAALDAKEGVTVCYGPAYSSAISTQPTPQ